MLYMTGHFWTQKDQESLITKILTLISAFCIHFSHGDGVWLKAIIKPNLKQALLI